jgi:hypothetical protein
MNMHVHVASCPRRYVFEMIPDYARNVISGPLPGAVQQPS